MPRAKRIYTPGGVWHLTHRCHNRDFLLKFRPDRVRWSYWLFQARKRVATDHHLIQCLVYIDLNMVRARVVRHPAQWSDAGHHEIQTPPTRYRVIDFEALCRLTQSSSPEA